MGNNIPEMHIGQRGNWGPPEGAVYSGGAPVNPGFVATPPPQIIQPTRADPSRRVLGLVPAQAGGLHPLVIRDAPKERVDPKEVSKLRAEKRKAEVASKHAEAGLIAAASGGGVGSPEYQKALLHSRDATDLVAALTRKLGELEAAAVARPTRVELAVVREPSEVPEALADTDRPTWWVCLHDGCKHERWGTEADMRRAHPTHGEMQRKQQTHVYALLSEAPIDPIDPGAGTVGYIAPVGRDGTRVEMIAEQAGESAPDVEELRAAMQAQVAVIAEMRQEMAALKAEKKAK